LLFPRIAIYCATSLARALDRIISHAKQSGDFSIWNSAKNLNHTDERITNMGYPPVTVHDSTSYNVSGKVSYASIFCSDDDYSATPSTTWNGPGRGVCLVTEITATVKTPNGDIVATPYSSSGTSYSEYAVITTSGTTFQVTRVVSQQEDEKPADYVEPKEKQK